MAFIWNALKSLGRWLTLGIVLLALVWASFFLIFAPDLPETNNLLLQSTGAEVVVLARDGSVLSRAGGGQILIRDLPPHLPQAVLATEDRRFYEHFGMDIIGFARAALASLKAAMASSPRHDAISANPRVTCRSARPPCLQGF